jgi:ribosome-binding protein aMBF1 (putative translation factor)
MTNVNDLHRKWMKRKECREAHEALAPEFAVARAVIHARVTAGLTQEQLAKRMATTQSVVARLESGRTRPSTETLERFAAATGTRLRITFEPEATRQQASAPRCAFWALVSSAGRCKSTPAIGIAGGNAYATTRNQQLAAL